MTEQPSARLLFLLETVEREGRRLLGTTARLFTQNYAWCLAVATAAAARGVLLGTVLTQ